MKYVITGATGDIGSRVVKRLLLRGERPRVFVRDPVKAQSRFGSGVDIFVGDLADPGSLRAALAGADALFLVTTGPEIPVRDQAAAHAAQAAGVRRLVKLSSLDAGYGLAIGAWHEQGEAAIRASGLPFTFVQPSGFMSNLLAWAPSIKAEGVMRASTGDGKRAFIHSDDIADIATRALTTGEHEGASLALTGPEALSFAEVAARMEAAAGRPVRFEAISDQEAQRLYTATGAPPAEALAHVALWRAIREGRLARVTNTVEKVLGRPPIPLDKWVLENAAAFRG